MCYRADSLACKTLAYLTIPGSLAVLFCHTALDINNKLLRYSDRHEQGSWVYISAAAVRQLFERPNELIACVGGNPEQYEAVRLRSPRNFLAENYAVSSFPILLIKDCSGYGINGSNVPFPLLMKNKTIKNSEDSKLGLFKSLEQ